jgi:hypothetical protein
VGNVQPTTADIQLADDSIVVRFGEMTDMNMSFNAAKHYAMCIEEGRSPEYVLSVHSMPDMNPDEVAVYAQRPWPKYQHATKGILESAGYPIRLEDVRDGHSALVLPTPPTRTNWDDLRSIFGPERPNPKPVKPRDRKL